MEATTSEKTLLEMIRNMEYSQTAIVRQMELLSSQQERIIAQIESIKPKEVKRRETEKRFSGLLIYSNLPRSYIYELERKTHKLIDKNGHIRGATRGNEMFKFGGRHNQLSDVGNMVLERILKKKDPKVRNFEENLDFHIEREKCLEEFQLFEDPNFKADQELLYNKHKNNPNVQWKRPGEIAKNPGFIVNGHSRFDINQGSLNDCWFISSIAYLTLRDELFFRVVMPDNSFIDNYAGIFHFQFNRYGEWVDVVIDDLLPTIDGKLIYVKSTDDDEFWGALVEKAYAKLYGGYENLNFGMSSEAFEDFTGGATQSVIIPYSDHNSMLPLLTSAFKMGCLIGCGVNEKDVSKHSELKIRGLTNKHVYTITGIHAFKTIAGYSSVNLIRIRNPHGDSTEWNGDYSDTCPKWSEIDEIEKDDWNVQNLEDGEFWMSPQDFMKYFYVVSICQIPNNNRIDIHRRIGNTELPEDLTEEYELRFEGKWSISDGTAGGLKNLKQNKQYNIIVGDPEDETKKKVEFFLMQTRLREQKKMATFSYISVFPIDSEDEVLTDEKIAQGSLRVEYFDERDKIEVVKNYISQEESEIKNDVFQYNAAGYERQFICYSMLSPGMYAVVPSKMIPDDEGEFVLRIFSESVVLEAANRHKLPKLLKQLRRLETQKSVEDPDDACCIM